MLKFNIYGRGRPLQWAIMFTCQVAFIFFGYDQGIFSGIVGNEDFLNVVQHPSAGMLGIIVSIYPLGSFFGTIVSFLLTDRIGLRKSIWLSMGLIIIGATLQTAAFSRAQLLVARFVTGLGTGIETATVPMYQSELCEAKKRGKYVCSEALYVCIGIVIAYWFDYGMSYVHGPISWRLPVACQMIFAIMVGLMIFGLPESPRWLYRHDRNDEALKVLCDVYDLDPTDQKIVTESEGILEAIRLETLHGEYKWSKLLQRDEVQTGRRVILAYGIQFMNQMCGINLVVYYVTTVLQYNVGLERQLSLLLGGVIQIMFLIGSLYPTFFSDRHGRRRPMMWGTFGMGISMMMIAVLLSFKGTSVEKPTATASVAFFFLFVLMDGTSVNCIPWVYGPEILPLHVRAKGQPIGISANWLWNFFVVMITPTLIDNLHWKGYLIFMCLNLSFVPIIYFFYPETANLTLEEVDFIFMEGNSSLHPRQSSLGETKAAGEAVSDSAEMNEEQVENKSHSY